MDFLQYKEFLEEKVALYHQPNFIESDPVQIPHLYAKKEDIHIAGFLAATIAWGNRKMIINNAQKLMSMMDDNPYEFVMDFDKKSEKYLEKFVHRTFNGADMLYFMYAFQNNYKNNGGMEQVVTQNATKHPIQPALKALRNIYQNHGGMEQDFTQNANKDSLQPGIVAFRKIFMEKDAVNRAGKHISDPSRNSAAKRINMFLRWMVRQNSPVDFGIWKNINAA